MQLPDAQNTTENVTYTAKFAFPFSLKATFYTFIAQLSPQSQSRLPSFILTKELTNSKENITPFPLWIKQNYPTKSYFENQKMGCNQCLKMVHIHCPVQKQEIDFLVVGVERESSRPITSWHTKTSRKTSTPQAALRRFSNAKALLESSLPGTSRTSTF